MCFPVQGIVILNIVESVALHRREVAFEISTGRQRVGARECHLCSRLHFYGVSRLLSKTTALLVTSSRLRASILRHYARNFANRIQFSYYNSAVISVVIADVDAPGVV